jgi:hypothetical protein
MSGLPKSQMNRTERELHPLVGSAVIKTPLPAKSDLSDWVGLMELVQALCPKWPARPEEKYGEFRL